MAKSKQLNFLGLAISLVLLGICLLFVIPAALSGNMFFAFGRISQKPEQVIIYRDGETHIFEPGSTEYDKLVDAAYDALKTEIGIEESGWSEDHLSFSYHVLMRTNIYMEFIL